jgi:hypothetical protein
MLDHFDMGSGRMGRVEGLLPGASPRDGEAFNPKARKLFIAGKSLELERYLALYNGKFKRGEGVFRPLWMSRQMCRASGIE